MESTPQISSRDWTVFRKAGVQFEAVTNSTTLHVTLQDGMGAVSNGGRFDPNKWMGFSNSRNHLHFFQKGWSCFFSVCSRWWFQTLFFSLCSPLVGENYPSGGSYFSTAEGREIFGEESMGPSKTQFEITTCHVSSRK